MHTLIARDVEQRVKGVEGVKNVKVNVVWDPPWTPDRISEEGKKILGFEK